jgi:hypothetical protein
MSKQLPTTEEELNSHVQAEVAKATSKLQSELAKANKEKETLTSAAEKAKADITEKDKSIAELSLKIKSFESANNTDISAVIQETAEKTERKLRAEFDTQTQQLKQQLEALQSKEKDAALKELRLKLIAEAGGEDSLLPALVKGNNEEELKASIDYSKSIFADAQARIAKNTPAPQVAPVAPPAPNSPPAPAPAPSVNVLPVAPSNVPPVPPVAPTEGAPPATPKARPSRSEWAAQRHTALASLQGRYAAGAPVS